MQRVITKNILFEPPANTEIGRPTWHFAVVIACAFSLIGAVSAGTARAAGPAWFECAAQEAELGDWANAACSESSSKKGNYERLAIALTNYTATSGEVKLETASDLISCKKSEASGTLEAPSLAREVNTKLTGCKGEDRISKGTCSVNSTKPKGGTEEILFNLLHGELGRVAASEAASLVGLLLLPPTLGALSEVEGSCLLPKSTAIEGAFIAEVTPVGETHTSSKLGYSLSGGKQKIKKFEGGSTHVLKAFGVSEAPFSATDEISYEKSGEIGVGEMVQPANPVMFWWKVETTTLGTNVEKPMKNLRLVGTTKIKFLGTLETHTFTVECTTLTQAASPPPKIIGGPGAGKPGEGVAQWSLSGCSIPVPTNCLLEQTSVDTSELKIQIMEGLAQSARRVLLRFLPVSNFVEFKPINNGGNVCTLNGKTIAPQGSVVAEALDPSTDELGTRKYKFEPLQSRTVGAYKTTAPIYYRVATGLEVGSSDLNIDGEISFQVGTPGAELFTAF